ncbi:tRNA lysidine synthetase, partial [Globisporangium splendens]
MDPPMASSSSSVAPEALAILDFWFGGDQKDNYRTKWFPPEASEKQRAMDATIAERFGSLLEQAQRNELEHWQQHRDASVALTVLLDQFSRHVYRHENKEQLRRNDEHALALAQAFVVKNWHVNLDVPQFVFVMMPMRHTPTPERLHSLLDTIEARETLQTAHVDLLEKFRRTTQSRLQHLRGEKTVESDDDILERHFMVTDESDMPKHRLYKAMHEYLVKMDAKKYSHMAVSLSGGVDSMVVAHLLHKLRPLHNNFTIVAVHLDYGNREESRAECEYVRKWCERFGILFHVRRIDEVKRNSTKRDDYERISREIRYATYAQVMAQYGAPGMCFGHHRGDVQENVISNMMKGLSLLGLNGMSESSIVNGVRIWRPLLDFEKDVIFEFAHRYGVPYFKDTTPAWSTRGKLRNQLVPLLRELYGDGFLNNLSNLGAESTQCAELIDQNILAPIMASVGMSEVAVWIDCTLLVNQPFFVWKEVLRSICHSIMGNSMVREKPIRELIMKLVRHTGTTGAWVTLKKGNRSYITADRKLIIFRDRFFPRAPYAQPLTAININETYTFGPWTLTTSVLESDDSKTQNLQSQPSLTMWDVIHGNGLEYVFPNAPQLVLDSENRRPVLRALEKVITDFVPIVASRGAFDDAHKAAKWVHVQLQYTNQQQQPAEDS